MAVLKWHGGKHYLAKTIVELMPSHLHYVEPYFGSGAVLFAKNKLGSEVINDLNGEVTNFWRVLQDEERFKKFIRRMEATPFSEVEWMDSFEPTTSGIELAARFFIRYRMSRQALGTDFATLSRNRVRRGMNEQVSAWLTCVDGLYEAHERMRSVVVLRRDALDVIRTQDGVNTLFYLDPPYPEETRTAGSYAVECDMDHHSKLLRLLQDVKGKFILSTYPNDLYRAAGFHIRELYPSKPSGGGGGSIEWLLTNF